MPDSKIRPATGGSPSSPGSYFQWRTDVRTPLPTEDSLPWPHPTYCGELSQAYIHLKANQQNAQFSQGPVSAEGLERSSKNAIKHGLTGQTLVLAPEEAESYSAHVSEYMAHYEPSGHYQRQLIQQLADSDWGVHQVFLLQSATISYMHSLSRKLAADPDNAELQAADARAVRKLATLNSYENRKRRASKMLREQIDELALQESVSKPPSKPMETKPEPEIGFVHPGPSAPPAGNDLQAWLRSQTAGMTVEEALKFAKSRR